MSKSSEKTRARELRRLGKSIKNIAELLRVSKSTVSLWCRDIILSSAQVERLIENQIKSGYKGRMMGAAANRKKREDVIMMYQREGRDKTRKVSMRELQMLGLGLYIGEGRKSGNRFTFTNSDPAVINMILLWLKIIFNIGKEDIRCRIYINKIHEQRVEAVRRSWSQITGVPKKQFLRTVLINAKVKKTYENHDSYLGVLAVHVVKSSRLFYEILGLIEGLMYNLKVHTPA